MVRQEAMLGSPCQEPLLLDDIVSWHRHDPDFGQGLKNLRSVHSTGQKNPASGSSFWESNSNSLRI